MRRFLVTLASAALLLCLGLPLAPAVAAPCDGSSDPCTIDLGRATASFAAGAASYFAEAMVVQGTDVSVNANAQLLSSTQVTHGAISDSLIIGPQIYSSVGAVESRGCTKRVQHCSSPACLSPRIRATRSPACKPSSKAVLCSRAMPTAGLASRAPCSGRLLQTTWPPGPSTQAPQT